MYVNGKNISKYGAMLQSEYIVSGVNLETAYSAYGQFPLLHSQRAGVRTINVTLTFRGKDADDAYARYSEFCRDILGPIEIVLPDGKEYRAVLSSIGEEEFIADGYMQQTFEFIGSKHGKKETCTGNKIFCKSTLPKTACVMTATVGKAGSNYRFGSITFASVKAGDVLTFDGINTRILVNGVPAAEKASWTRLPYLTPGINNFDCEDTLTIEYYPAYF